MSIKKRKTTPHVNYEPDEQVEARHPMLRSGLWRDVYLFVERNPDATRRDIAKGTGLPNNVATARTKELIDEGFLFETGRRKLNPSGVRAKCIRVTSRNQGGKPLDKVRIEVTLTVDRNGVYGAKATVVDSLPQAKPAVGVLKKKLTLTAPHPDTYLSSFEDTDVAEVSPSEVEHFAGDIIDAEIIKD